MLSQHLVYGMCGHDQEVRVAGLDDIAASHGVRHGFQVDLTSVSPTGLSAGCQHWASDVGTAASAHHASIAT
jgi:hypothetical protein